MSTPLRFPKIFQPLRHRRFVLLWAGRNLSRLGDAVFKVAISWAVLEVGKSSLAVAITLTVNVLPQVLLSLVAGSLGDRLPRTTVLIATDIVALVGTSAVSILVAKGKANLISLIFIAALLGVCKALAAPALGPLLGDTIPREENRQANSLDSATFSAMALFGPIAGGLLLVHSEWLAFAFNAATFAVSAFFISLMGLSREKVKYRTLDRLGIITGLKYARSLPWLKPLIVLSAITNIFSIAPFFVLLPLKARYLGLPPSVFGATLAAQGFGAISGAAVIGQWRGKFRSGDALIVMAPLAGLSCIILGISQTPGLITLSGLIIGIAGSFAIIENSILQTHVSADYQSRVYSIVLFGSFLLLPLAYMITGLVGKVIDIGLVLMICGVTDIGLSLCILISPRSRALRDLSS